MAGMMNQARCWARVALAVLMGCLSCATGDTFETTGALAMRLSTDVNGVTYRLSAARFDVAGPESAALNSDDNPSASSLELDLSPGNYEVLLRDGWRLEKRPPGGEFQTVIAELVSPNPAAFTIVDGETTELAFAFETDGIIVDFGEGTLNLVIEVSDMSNPPSGNCVAPGSVNDIELRVFYTETSAANQIGMVLAVQNTGIDFSTSDLVVRYWFTPGTTAPFDFSVDFAQTAASTTITDAVDVSFGATAASAFADITIDRAVPIGFGISSIQLRLFALGFQNLMQSDDFSFVDGASNVVNENITAYVGGVQVFGCEPPLTLR